MLPRVLTATAVLACSAAVVAAPATEAGGGDGALLHAYDRSERFLSDLTLGPDGALQGGSLMGGAHSGGTAFHYSLAGSYTRIQDFDEPVEISQPRAGPTVGSDGHPYGATTVGSTYFSGALPKSRDAQRRSYFQLRDFPSAIHSSAEARRLARVSSRLASAIHSA